jgi:hypothetical protein
VGAAESAEGRALQSDRWLLLPPIVPVFAADVPCHRYCDVHGCNSNSSAPADVPATHSRNFIAPSIRGCRLTGNSSPISILCTWMLLMSWASP